MDNGRTALLGAFLWPQHRRRRQKQRAAARLDNQSGGCTGDSCAGPSGPELLLAGGCLGCPNAPRARRARSHEKRQIEGLGLMPPALNEV